MKSCFGLLLASFALCGQSTDGFELLGRYKGLGALVASAVGPGREAGSERLYLSYLYVNNTIDVVAVDPRTGAFEVFPNPAPTEGGARCMAAGPDGNMYLGTLPSAHLLKLDVKAGKLVDVGRPAPSEQYIWDVAFGSDKKLYGVTYPQAKLVRYDPATGKMEDLGRMDPKEQYARHVATTADGFVYIAIGTSRADLVAYEIASGRHRSVLPPDRTGSGSRPSSSDRTARSVRRLGSAPSAPRGGPRNTSPPIAFRRRSRRAALRLRGQHARPAPHRIRPGGRRIVRDPGAAHRPGEVRPRTQARSANTSPGEHALGQFNSLSHSYEFERWSPPVGCA